MSLTKVVLIGATGNIGSIILTSLVTSPNLTITILTRDTSASSIPYPLSDNLKIVKTAYTLPALIDAFKGQDAVISAVGAAGLSEQKLFIDAAIDAGVKRFIPSEFSINTQSEAVRRLIPVFEAKWEVLRYLREKETTGLTWTGLAVGLLFDWGLYSGFLGFDLASQTVTLWDGGKNAFSVTNQKDMGAAVLSILDKPQQTANKYLYVTSVTTTQQSILESLEKQSGLTWKQSNVDTKEQLEDAKAKLATGDLSGVFTLVQAAGYGNIPGIRANYEAEEELANQLLGLQNGCVEETVKIVLQAST